jgi:hypothetical protein
MGLAADNLLLKTMILCKIPIYYKKTFVKIKSSSYHCGLIRKNGPYKFPYSKQERYFLQKMCLLVLVLLLRRERFAVFWSSRH